MKLIETLLVLVGGIMWVLSVFAPEPQATAIYVRGIGLIVLSLVSRDINRR